MADAARRSDALAASEVADWLRAHPRFLAEMPDLYRWLAPPARVHGEAFADHMAAMLRAERAHAAAMAERADGVLAAGRAAAGLAARVQEAVLALMASADTAECVASELPAILAVDAASLCCEGSPPAPIRPLPAGSVARLLGAAASVLREAPEDAALLHGEAAPLACHDALVRVPGRVPGLLALAARDRRVLAEGQGALGFLGRAVAVALRR